jgi:DNA invertase Pin-like site-specific DNA recombinase
VSASEPDSRAIRRPPVEAKISHLAHARESRTRLGRLPTAAANAKQIRQLFRAGFSKAAIARQLQIGRTSVRRILSKGSNG